jgi:hypothetical protein
LRTAVLSFLLASFLILSLSVTSRAWDSIKNQFLPDDMLDRAPEVYGGYDFDDVIFTRENFYNRNAGTKQYRRSIVAPQKSMEFEVFKPVEVEPVPQTKIVNKDGRAVTEISIKKEPEAESETQ